MGVPGPAPEGHDAEPTDEAHDSGDWTRVYRQAQMVGPSGERWSRRERTHLGMSVHDPDAADSSANLPQAPSTRPVTGLLPPPAPTDDPDDLTNQPPLASIFRYRSHAWSSAQRSGELDQPDDVGIDVPAVRLTNGHDFSRQYKRHLKNGRLFVPGEYDLEPGDPIAAELVLTGYSTIRVSGMVDYVVPRALAKSVGRCGLGMAIHRSSRELAPILSAYLIRTKLRPHAAVFVAGEFARELVKDTGYKIEPAPPLSRFIRTMRQDRVVVGLVVTDEWYGEYAPLTGSPFSDLLWQVNDASQLDELVRFLDDRTLAAASE